MPKPKLRRPTRYTGSVSIYRLHEEQALAELDTRQKFQLKWKELRERVLGRKNRVQPAFGGADGAASSDEEDGSLKLNRRFTQYQSETHAQTSTKPKGKQIVGFRPWDLDFTLPEPEQQTPALTSDWDQPEHIQNVAYDESNSIDSNSSQIDEQDERTFHKSEMKRELEMKLRQALDDYERTLRERDIDDDQIQKYQALRRRLLKVLQT